MKDFIGRLYLHTLACVLLAGSVVMVGNALAAVGVPAVSVLATISFLGSSILTIWGVKTNLGRLPWVYIAIGWAIISVWPIYAIDKGVNFTAVLILVALMLTHYVLMVPMMARQAGRVGQAVTGSAVGGAVNQVGAVTGNVVIGGPKPAVVVGIVDAQAREMFGEQGAEFIHGRPLADHDWRLTVEYRTTTGGIASVTMPRGATADDVAALIERDRRDGRVE